MVCELRLSSSRETAAPSMLGFVVSRLLVSARLQGTDNKYTVYSSGINTYTLAVYTMHVPLVLFLHGFSVTGLYLDWWNVCGSPVRALCEM